MDKAALEERLAELPLYSYGFFDTRELEFTDRVRWVCEHECPMYGTTWACPLLWGRWRNAGRSA